MSFWKSDLGEITGSAADSFAKSIKQIPDGTTSLSEVVAASVQEYNGEKFIAITWKITDAIFGGQLINMKIKKLFSGDLSDKTRHRSLNMLKLIYQLFGIKPSSGGEPTDKDLSAFVGKKAGIKIRETEPNENGKQYNWVSEVHPVEGFKSEIGVSIVVTKKHNSDYDSYINNHYPTSIGDDIPFYN